MEPSPTATDSVGEIKEVNHPEDDLWAFQMKEQLKKKKAKKKKSLKKKSVLSLQAFPGNSGWPGLISSLPSLT